MYYPTSNRLAVRNRLRNYLRRIPSLSLASLPIVADQLRMSHAEAERAVADLVSDGAAVVAALGRVRLTKSGRHEARA